MKFSITQNLLFIQINNYKKSREKINLFSIIINNKFFSYNIYKKQKK